MIPTPTSLPGAPMPPSPPSDTDRVRKQARTLADSICPDSAWAYRWPLIYAVEAALRSSEERHAEEIARLTKERDEFSALVNEFSAEKTPEFLEGLSRDRDNWWKRALAAEARATAAEKAIAEAIHWHEAARKALGKQPPGGDRDWRRLQHQEQIDALQAALRPSAQSKEAGHGE